jgi:hypothetical protein
MRRASWLAAAGALTVAWAAPAAAQGAWSFEARSFAMGNAVVGVADDSAAWLQNPAGLPYLRVSTDSGSGWPALLSGTTDLGAKVDTIGVNYSARSAEDEEGWGIGYWHLGEYQLGALVTISIDKLGAGYGAVLRPGLTWGASVSRCDMSWELQQPIVPPPQLQEAMAAYTGDKTIFDLGLMYRGEQSGRQVKAGLVARDVTDQMETTFDVGASVKLPNGLLLAADIHDLTDEVDDRVNLGAEWQLPEAPEWKLGAGSSNGDLTYGASYDFGKWGLSVSRQHRDWDKVVAATLLRSL